MDKRLFFLINMAQHRMYRFVDTKCESLLGISVTQVAAMLFIAKHPGCLQKELSHALGLNNSAVTGLAGRMEKNGLIFRQPCPQDGRASRLTLSPAGEAKLPQIFPLIQEVNLLLTADFTEAEMAVVIRFLNRVMQRFE